MRTRYVSTMVGLIFAVLAGCAHAPQTRRQEQTLEARANTTVMSFEDHDPSITGLLQRAPGYVVFPEIASAAFLVGGHGGVGVLYRRGRPAGYVELNAGSIGAQAGGQTYSQIIVFQTEEALRRLMSGNFNLSADLRATLATSGAAATAEFEGGTAVFVEDEVGLMAGASLAGESLSYQSK